MPSDTPSPVTRLEVISVGARQRWTPERKRALVLETFDPGAKVNAVARHFPCQHAAPAVVVCAAGGLAMGKVFVSYARENADQANRMGERLKALGFDAWIDQSRLLATDDISNAIDREIEKVDVVLVLWSQLSKDSMWVRGEALKGLEFNKYVGVLLEPIAPPVPFNARNAPDLSDWTGLHKHGGWNMLVRGIATMCASGPAILKKLGEAQALETTEAASIEREQGAPELPLEPSPEIATASHYADVEALIGATTTFLSGAGKFDLSAAITQAALDQEMLRDAAFVVSKTPDKPAPAPAQCKVLGSIQKALDNAKPGDLIVLLPGRYEENIFIKKSVRLVGLGWLDQRPTIVEKSKNQPVVQFESSARLENIAIETHQSKYAVHCADNQPVLLRCVVSRFGAAQTDYDAAFYIAGKAKPIVMATSFTATGCPALYFAGAAGGRFLGVSIMAARASAVIVKSEGNPVFSACRVEAIGAHAIDTQNNAIPTFADCEIQGSGVSVIHAMGWARPRILDCRIKATRTAAFDIQGEASGRYERNIVDHIDVATADASKEPKGAFFGLLKSKENAIVRSASVISMRSTGKPLFMSNRMTGGEDMPIPPQPS